MSRPRIAIGLPVKDGEKYLRGALEAIRGQTFPDFVVHIVDNASTDATREIAESFARVDSRFHYSRNEQNVGSLENFHRAFASARLTGAPLFKWAAHDDRPRREYLAEVIAEFDDHPSVVAAHARPALVDDYGAEIPYSAEDNAFVTPAGDRWVWNRRLIRRLQVEDPARRLGAFLRAKAGEWMAYAVFRADVLAQTELFVAPGFEDTLCAEVLLRGPVSLVETPLFEHRLHAGSARYMSRRDYLAYEYGCDPGEGPLPSYARALQYSKAIRNAPISGLDRARCHAKLARFAVRPRQIANAILPGPNNYWGIDFTPTRERHVAPSPGEVRRPSRSLESCKTSSPSL
ncbi:glycosyltransferase family 2 protein [soil metagenome]